MALPLSPEHEVELAALRQRAYGPDADIEVDPDAIARLVELEDMTRTDAADTADVDGASDAGADSATSGTPAVPPSLVPPEDPPDPSAPAAGPRRRRRTPLWAFAAGAALVGLGLGWAIPSLVPPHPQTVLQVAPATGAPQNFELYGLEAVAPVRYDPYHELEVWSSITPTGAVCLLITANTGEWITAGCAAGDIDPIADFTVYAGMRTIEGLDLPVGSLVRFMLSDGAVEVWIDRSEEQT
ncbi:hypothetical protein [Microbacterium sp. cf046]|uniref:hypothetical protein n=1 Tax=Microbacterium sp. cf046 TaxID=1761803 RepID=UPI000B87C150|nr:hypothetical protein [Microbacterium sp. cf046]